MSLFLKLTLKEKFVRVKCYVLNFVRPSLFLLPVGGRIGKGEVDVIAL